MNHVALFSLLFLVANAAVASSDERWECALDLQQGDKGSMTLERSGTSVSGLINISRNGSEFEQELEGRWSGREVELKRFISSSTNQDMVGIAARVGSAQVKIGGRHAEGLNGVWSADCDLASSVKSRSGASVKQTQPSISMRATPFRPDSRSVIQFSAQAFHPDGIESVTFFVDDKSIHQCSNEQCTKKFGPLSAGSYKWHVVAKSKAGTEETTLSNELVVSNAGPAVSCTISGFASGPEVGQSEKVLIRLTGQADGKKVDKTARFDAGIYSFNAVPAGTYQLSIESPDSLAVLVSPTIAEKKCDETRSIRQDFDFR